MAVDVGTISASTPPTTRRRLLGTGPVNAPGRRLTGPAQTRWAHGETGGVGLPEAEGKTKTPYVVCVGTSPDDTAAVAKALAGRAVVIVASDADVIRPLFDGGTDTAPMESEPEPAAEPIGTTGRLTIDRMLRQVTWADQAVHLSPREF